VYPFPKFRFWYEERPFCSHIIPGSYTFQQYFIWGINKMNLKVSPQVFGSGTILVSLNSNPASEIQDYVDTKSQDSSCHIPHE